MIDRINPNLWLLKIAGLLLAVIAAVWWWGNHNATQQKIGYDRAMSEVKAKQAEIAEAKRLKELGDQEQANKEAKHAQEQIDDLSRERDLARADADRMRQQYRQAAERGRQSFACASGTSQGKPGGDPLGVFAELLERADQRAEEVAIYAEQLRIAGFACERIYDEIRN